MGLLTQITEEQRTERRETGKQGFYIKGNLQKPVDELAHDLLL